MKKSIVFVLIILSIAACRQKEEPKPQSLSQDQIRLQNELLMLQETVKKDPGNVNAWVNLGNILMDASRFDGAIEAYQKALALAPKNVDVRVDMGICYRNSGKPDIAVKEFRKAIEINPSHINAHKNLAVVLAYDFKENTQAIKEFEKSLQLAPNAPDAERIRQEIQKLKALPK